MNKNLLKRTISLFLTALMLLPVLNACSSDKKNDATSEVTQPPEPERDSAALLAADTLAADGLQYALDTCKTYYTKRSHTIKRSLKNANAAEIWYVAAFVEMLAETYKLYPDNEEIKDYYIDVLDNCLPGYLVKNATIKTPSGTFIRQTYYNAGKNSSGDFYYDDNAWICYQLIEAYKLLGEEKYLDTAEDVLEFLWTGWKKDGGGIYWSKDFKAVGTCSSSPTATCFLMAYKETQKQDYLDRAVQIYEWVNANVLKDDDLYRAGIGDNWAPSYDQGTMLMNGALLYEITGEDTYYKTAKRVATACISHCFNVSGKKGALNVSLKTNPFYCPWSFSWLIRGMMQFYNVDKSKNESLLQFTRTVFEKRAGIKNTNNQYDPYLGTGCKDWLGDGSTFGIDDVVIMPAGYSECLLLIGYFNAYMSEDAIES